MTIVRIKSKRHKKRCIIKRKLKFGDFKHCLERTQLTKKLKQNIIKKSKVEKSKIDVVNPKENHKDIKKTNKINFNTTAKS